MKNIFSYLKSNSSSIPSFFAGHDAVQHASLAASNVFALSSCEPGLLFLSPSQQHETETVIFAKDSLCFPFYSQEKTTAAISALITKRPMVNTQSPVPTLGMGQIFLCTRWARWFSSKLKRGSKVRMCFDNINACLLACSVQMCLFLRARKVEMPVLTLPSCVALPPIATTTDHGKRRKCRLLTG